MNGLIDVYVPMDGCINGLMCGCMAGIFHGWLHGFSSGCRSEDDKVGMDVWLVVAMIIARQGW